MSSEIIPIRDGEEIDLVKIESILKENIKNLPNETLSIKQFSAGRSNLTYLLKMGDWEAVLRRPPLGPVPPKAHDMEREFTILEEISPHFNPAPKPYLFFDNENSVIGSPFFIMERRKGIVVDTEFPSNITYTEDLGRKISEKMVDTLVSLHQIDYTKTKLKEMTKPSGFLERQVNGWIYRYERSKTEEIEGIEQLKRWMLKNIPVSPSPTIIHYDYKLNNLMFTNDFNEINGLFDWEMTTVGDPLADLGVAMSYWKEKSDSPLLRKGSDIDTVTVYPGFMTRNEFMELYARKSGRDVSNMNFYLTFSYFKLAVICQQIYYRWKNGQTKDARFKDLNLYVNNLIEYCLETSVNNNY
ncbi:phosphotransferase family protein [Oceanobacillus halophilus]|uniref:Phosphotransferase family protein n=1 Tax=Oceanobacillus halophilus TaxID=930130 RepID=A0A495ABC9_9BACI|nr:phosphotransferase family protein [Oceanobacillus halophilus]RKQ35736.1 phosphotransferase family protein [Oceanobacillus halophilus]